MIAFAVSLIDSQHDRELREAMLYALAAERLDAARASGDLKAHKGQKRTLEPMAQIGATIAGIDASGVDLSYVKLRDAHSEHQSFHRF